MRVQLLPPKAFIRSLLWIECTAYRVCDILLQDDFNKGRVFSDTIIGQCPSFVFTNPCSVGCHHCHIHPVKASWVAMRRDSRPTPLLSLGHRNAPRPIKACVPFISLRSHIHAYAFNTIYAKIKARHWISCSSGMCCCCMLLHVPLHASVMGV